jgi:hypothetical protein
MNPGAVHDLANALTTAGSYSETIAEALDRNFTSPNVPDSNAEHANVVDALDRIGDGLFAIAKAINPDVLKPAPPATGQPMRQLKRARR